MFTRSGFEKPSDPPVPKRRHRRSSSMPPKLDAEGQQAGPTPAAAAAKPPMMFSSAQFERLMKSFDAPSQRAAAAAEAARAAADTMQRALDILSDRGGAAAAVQDGVAQRAPTGDRISKRMPVFWDINLRYGSPCWRDTSKRLG